MYEEQKTRTIDQFNNWCDHYELLTKIPTFMIWVLRKGQK